MLLTKKEILDELNKLTDWEFIDSKIVKLIRREYIEELSSPKEKNFENYLTLAVSAIWSIAEKVDNSFRENLSLMKNKNIWIIFPNKKHKFEA